MWTTLPLFQQHVDDMLKRLDAGAANQGPGVEGGQADALAQGGADGGAQEGKEGGGAAGGGGGGGGAKQGGKRRRLGPKLQPALEGPYNPAEDDAFSTLIQVGRGSCDRPLDSELLPASWT